MSRCGSRLARIGISLALVSAIGVWSQTFDWKQLAPLPDPLGVAGPFAGVSHGALIVAGGANFPGAMPWEGGEKIWHDSIFVLPKSDAQWLAGFKLPHPIGYGVCVSARNGVLCAGGSDSKQHFRDVFLLRWRRGKIETETFPLLPHPMANGCGALVGNAFYIAGGIETPDATNALKTFWMLDLAESKPRWRELEPWPGPARMLAVAGSDAHSFYLFSGVELSADANGKPVRRYLNDAYCFTPKKGWKRLADLPRAAAAAPSPAIARDEKFFIVSGDDGALVNFEPKSAHPGFPKDVLAYDAKLNNWTRIERAPISRATAPIVKWRGIEVIVSGETRPGVRSPEMWAVLPSKVK